MNSKNALLGDHVKTYGPVIFGDNVIIEDGVVIGHPSPAELDSARSSVAQYFSLDAMYKDCTKSPTIIGDNSIIRSGSIIYSGCEIGHDFDCGHNVIIRENVYIGNEVYIKPSAYIMTNVHIGNYCRIAGTIADFSIIGNNVSSFGVLTHRRLRTRTEINASPKQPPKDGHGPVIGDNCVIGRNALVVGHVQIGNDCIIGANAFVDFDMPPKSKVLGMKG